MNTTDIISRLVGQLDEEIHAGYEAVGLLERARDQLLEFTDLPNRLVDTLAVDIGLQPAPSTTSAHGNLIVTDLVVHANGELIPAPATAAAGPTDAELVARYKTHHPQRKYTLHQVAEIWFRHDPRARPGERYVTLADQLWISIKGAEQAVIRARKKGLIPATGSTPPAAAPPPAPAAVPADPTPDNYDPDQVDWEAVAACYKQAILDGRRPIAALATEFDVAHHVANDWPKVCRRMGLLPPADQPQVETDPAPQQLVRHTPARPSAL